VRYKRVIARSGRYLFAGWNVVLHGSKAVGWEDDIQQRRDETETTDVNQYDGSRAQLAMYRHKHQSTLAAIVRVLTGAPVRRSPRSKHAPLISARKDTRPS
jgi:hypothetical protein